MPKSVERIEPNTFINCSSLYSITIPSSVKYIGNQAFYGCSSLTSITIPESVTGIAGGIFYHCTALTSVAILGTLRFIGSSVFSGCTALASIYMGSPQPPSETNKETLDEIPDSCIIYVPTGSIDAYSAVEPWNNYLIKEYDATGIGSIETAAPTAVGYYDLHGRRLHTPAKCLHIVRYSDGTTRKMFVK